MCFKTILNIVHMLHIHYKNNSIDFHATPTAPKQIGIYRCCEPYTLISLCNSRLFDDYITIRYRLVAPY